MSKIAAIALILGCFGCGGIAEHESCAGVAVGHDDEWTYVSHAHGGSHASRWIWLEVPPGEFACVVDWERDELCVTYRAPTIEGGEADNHNPPMCGGAS